MELGERKNEAGGGGGEKMRVGRGEREKRGNVGFDLGGGKSSDIPCAGTPLQSLPC